MAETNINHLFLYMTVKGKVRPRTDHEVPEGE